MAKSIFLAGVCLLLALCVLPAQSIFCWVNVNSDFSKRQPLVLKPHSDEFFYPSGKDLQMTICDTLRVACPGDDVQVFSNSLDSETATLTCYGLTFFGVKHTRYSAPFKKIGCANSPVPEANDTEKICPNGTVAHIGFQLTGGSFIPTVEEICHNETLGQTHWAHSKVVPQSKKHQKTGDDPAYNAGSFYPNISMTPSIYERPNEKARFEELLGSTDLANKYIPNTGDNYLVPGMLAPRSDMFYRAQQDSTFFYVNTVPMWKSVRDGNWKTVEESVRSAAAKRKQTLDVWTGGVDVLTYSDSEGNATEITLTTNGDMEGVVPVPKFLFKQVVDKSRKRGIVYVTVNDPHVTAITAAEQICPSQPQCARLHPEFNVATKGFTYCCTLDGFAPVAARLGVPTFSGTQLLLK